VNAGDSSRGNRLRDALRARRDRERLRRRQEDELNSSVNVPLCKSEEEVLKKKDWMKEVKDLNGSFSKLPPISCQRKVAATGQSFYVQLDGQK